MISRIIARQISEAMGKGKAILIMGARQVGKSTLLQMLLGRREDVFWLSGDDTDVQSMFAQINATRLKAIMGDKKVLVVDEAQRISDIGLRLKIVTDQMPDVQLIATGSSSFELASKVNEPLTGRKREFRMFPLTFREMVNHTSLLDELRMLPQRLLFGSYPEVVANPGQERAILKELVESYLYRDVLSLDRIAKSDKLLSLLKALAFQIGSQVSYNEVGQLVGLDPKTVERYIDILEKSYVLFRLNSFSRNLRNELKTTRKIYFWDLGIRNALVSNFAPLENRTDVGELWENYVIAERLKQNSYRGSFASSYFWRTRSQQEIDYIEEEDGELRAYEFKWNARKGNAKCPESFRVAYPQATYKVITPDNIEEWL